VLARRPPRSLREEFRENRWQELFLTIEGDC
jgi:hypothetical protein